MFTSRGKTLLEPRLHSYTVGGFIVTQAPPLPSHFSGYFYAPINEAEGSTPEIGMGNAEGGSHQEGAPGDHPALSPRSWYSFGPQVQLAEAPRGRGLPSKSYWGLVGLILQGFLCSRELRPARRVGSRRAQSVRESRS